MSSLNQEWRGCASSFDQQLNHADELEAKSLMEKLHLVNCEQLNPPIPNIEYRSSEKDLDILRQVFKWDIAPYQEVFKHGFRVNRENGILDETFYNLHDYVQEIEQDLDSRAESKFGFIKTSISNSFYPVITGHSRYPNKYVEIYRYEIYAPGGIWPGITLGDRYPRIPKRYDEVLFVFGIAPQYIRSAQLFKIKVTSQRTIWRVERVNNILIFNNLFNPQSHPLKFLKLEIPICDTLNEHHKRVPLQLKFHHDHHYDHSSPNNGSIEWYSQEVTNIETYLDAAFRSSYQNEAYYIQKNWSALVDYNPTGQEDKILEGPYVIRYMFQCLKNMPFGQHGIDCAFGSHHPTNKAYVFSSNICALINYGQHNTNDKILKGPTTITHLFSFLKGTIFEGGIDAAFEATTKYEAYLFRGNQCARVNYSSDPSIIFAGATSQVFSYLKGTVFEDRIDAAYASHVHDEVYLFSYDTYCRINFSDDTMIYSGKIGSQGQGIASLFPLKNRGLDLGPFDDLPPKSNRVVFENMNLFLPFVAV